MADDGDYAFVVYVENRFLKENSPIIQVTHHFYDKNDPENQEDLDGYSVHYIHFRDSLCFPLYWRKEYLAITLKDESGYELWNKLPNQYHIWCGPMARVQLCLCSQSISLFTNLKGNQLYPSITTFSGDITYDKNDKKYKRKLDGNNNWYLEGGSWIFKKESKEPDLVFPIETRWTLNLYKLVHDPEEENVTIGENPPG